MNVIIKYRKYGAHMWGAHVFPITSYKSPDLYNTLTLHYIMIEKNIFIRN